MDYKTKLNTVKEIVNRHIANFTATDSTIITTEQSFVISDSTELLHFESNDKTFDKIFNLKAPNQKTIIQSFFHYKSFDIAYKFVEEDYVTASALSNFVGVTDDIQEYEHFFEVTNLDYKKSFIEEQKDNLYIFCLTEDNKTERFWNEYVNDHKGLCLEFEFIDKRHLWHMFELRKICYDNGSDFIFYASMQNEIFNVFNKYLNTPGLSKFGALYKRKTKFDWEKETRLLFNWGLYNADLIKNSFGTQTFGLKKFLKIPFDNNLFTINLKSITIGKNLDPIQQSKIKELADKKAITTYDER